jgi:hypothetical protein
MTSRENFETAVREAVTSLVEGAFPALERAGVRRGTADLVRGGTRENESEIRVYVYRHEQICDALEVRIWGDGKALVDLDELTAWFRDQLHALAT